MERVLIIGPTGNIGMKVIQALVKLNVDFEVIAAVRNIEKAKKKFSDEPNLGFREFDFENNETFNSAFKGIKTLFLLRPPHISDVKKYFQPLLKSAEESKVQNIVFLSVQGAEKSTIIPHNKIEKLINAHDFNSIFVRPSYFMQNLTTTLLPEIVKDSTITLPSGKAKFNWIDAKNIGEATAVLIQSFEKYQNKAYEITGTENKNFFEVVELMSQLTGTKFTYRSINPISFYFKKRKQGIQSGFAVVMTILHFLPRFQKVPEISENYKMLTNEKPTTLEEFIEREKDQFVNS